MKTIQFDFDNVSGISAVYAIPVTSYGGIEHDFISGQDSLLLGRTDGIIKIPIYDNDSFSFTEQQSREDGGEIWNVEIAGIIPKLCPLNDKIIRTLERGEWLVLHQDANGAIQLSGSSTVPLHFTSSKSAGQNSVNGNSFTFSASEPEPSIFIRTIPL